MHSSMPLIESTQQMTFEKIYISPKICYRYNKVIAKIFIFIFKKQIEKIATYFDHHLYNGT